MDIVLWFVLFLNIELWIISLLTSLGGGLFHYWWKPQVQTKTNDLSMVSDKLLSLLYVVSSTSPSRAGNEIKIT